MTTHNLSATVPTPDFKLKNVPIDRITVLTLLGADSERYPNIKTPTFVEPIFKQKTYLPLRGRLLNYVTNRIYRLKDNEGKEDWGIPPLCFSNNGENPAPELTDSYSEKCKEYNEEGKPVLCQFARKTKMNPLDKKPTMPAECRELLYFLIYLETGELYWVCFRGGARIFQGNQFLAELRKTIGRKKISNIYDYIVEINLIKRPFKRETGDFVYPIVPTFKILNYDNDEGYNPDENINELVQHWVQKSPYTLYHYITKNDYNVEETQTEKD